MGGRCAVAAAVSVWGAMLVGHRLGLASVTGCLIALPLTAWLALRAPPRVGTVLALSSLALAAFARAGASHLALERGVHGLGESEPPRWIHARVVEHPLREADAPLATVRLLIPASPLPAGTAIRLRLPPDCAAEWGDTLLALVALERPAERSNPGGFSPREAAASLGIAVQGRALVATVAPARGASGWAHASAVRWRRAAEQVLARGLSPEA